MMQVLWKAKTVKSNQKIIKIILTKLNKVFKEIFRIN